MGHREALYPNGSWSVKKKVDSTVVPPAASTPLGQPSVAFSPVASQRSPSPTFEACISYGC